MKQSNDKNVLEGSPTLLIGAKISVNDVGKLAVNDIVVTMS